MNWKVMLPLKEETAKRLVRYGIRNGCLIYGDDPLRMDDVERGAVIEFAVRHLVFEIAHTGKLDDP